MVKIGATRTCIYCKQYKINKHMCWNRHCLDFAVIRLLVEKPKELTCNQCEKWIDPISMLCVHERCLSYGDREDDYAEEDELIENILHIDNPYDDDNDEDSEEEEASIEEDEEATIKRKCKEFISENDPITRCHSTLRNIYLDALVSKVRFVRLHLHLWQDEGCEWRCSKKLKCNN